MLAALQAAPLAAPSVAQLRRAGGEVIGKAHACRFLVPCARAERICDQQSGLAQRARQRSIARIARIELGQAEAIPARPFRKHFRENGGQPRCDVRAFQGNNAVLEAVRVGQAGKPSPGLSWDRLHQERGCRGRPFVGVGPDLGSRRHAVAGHQIVPAGKRKKTVYRAASVEDRGEPARRPPKIRISVDCHERSCRGPRSRALLLRCVQKIEANGCLLVVPAKAGIHMWTADHSAYALSC